MTADRLGDDDSRPRLNTLDGEPVPPGLAAAIRDVSNLPVAAREAFTDLVRQYITAPPDDRRQTRLERMGRDLDVDPKLLVPPLEAVCLLLTHAARNATPREALLVDLRALAGDEAFAAVQDVVLPAYEALVPSLRKELLLTSIANHGNVVRDIDWRFDVVKASKHALHIEAPLTSLTFAYQEGPTPRRITLQLLPYQLKELRDICLEVVGDAPRNAGDDPGAGFAPSEP